MSKTGGVNVRMVITEEKIISNIDKIQKMINPKNKKQIVQLDEDTHFKDLIESIKSYILEYPNKKKFPSNVYDEAYKLVNFSVKQFESNTRKVEKLIKKREENISLAGKLSDLLEKVDNKEKGYKEKIQQNADKFSEEVIEALNSIGRCKGKTSQKYKDSMKIVKTTISNLESNLHIEIDMERIEDSSKALSYIGVEISDALKEIQVPVKKVKEEKIVEVEEAIEEDTKINIQTLSNDEVNPKENIEEIVEEIEEAKANIQEINETNNDVVEEKENLQVIEEQNDIKDADIESIKNRIAKYQEDTTFEVKEKESIWKKFKKSKFFKVATYIFRIRVVIELPSNALPEGRGE